MTDPAARKARPDPTLTELIEMLNERYDNPEDRLTIALGNFSRVRAEREKARAQLEQMREALRDEGAAAMFLLGEYVEPFGERGIHMADAHQIVACLRGVAALAAVPDPEAVSRG